MRSSSNALKTKTSKANKRTPTFTCELPLRVGFSVGRILAARIEAARQAYNAALGEALRRMRLVRQSVWFAKAMATPRGNKQERQAHFRAARAQHDFSDSALQRYGISLRSSAGVRTWIGKHLGAHEVQHLATRAYRAVNEYLLGLHGRPRFKGKGRMHSVEGKGPGSGLRWKNNRVVWGDLVLRPIIAHQDPVVRYALSCRVKYIRIVRRRVHLRTRWYVQLVCEGQPYRKPKNHIGKGVVGLDLGPSTVAVVSAKEAVLQPFCPEVIEPQREIRRLQRQIDRQRRANNPQNHLPDGSIKPGRKRWVVSQRQKACEAALGDLHRRLAASRKTSHGRLVNRILGMGDTFRLEKVSCRAFQRTFGRSVGRRAPGMFVGHLSRKADSAGGTAIAFPTRTTALSQRCHCGRRAKKPLSLRWHHCPNCGADAQRDLYSAFLARFVYETEDGFLLDAGQASLAWPGAEPLLRAAYEQGRQNNKPASGSVLRPSPARGQSGSHAQGALAPTRVLQAEVKSQEAIPAQA